MSKTVYVGRIPFDMTEEQLEDIFRSTGPVQQTRLMFDRATGKSKGFAFVHYFDAESAASAVRNLDNYKVGNLRLKVNYSSGSFQGPSGGGGHANRPRADEPPGQPEPQESGAIQDIVNVVSDLPQGEKTALLAELKQLAQDDAGAALALLDTNPQLAYAVVQTMFEVGAIDGAKAVSLIADPAGAAPPRDSTPAAPPKRQERKRTAARAGSHAQSTPQPSPQPTKAPPKAKLPPKPRPADWKQMIRQILALTPEQLDAMPAEQRNAALLLREQVESGEVVLD